MVSNKHPSRGGAFVGRCVYYREAFIEKKSQKRGHLFEGAFIQSITVLAKLSNNYCCSLFSEAATRGVLQRSCS